jgi:hypothetical protein
MPGFSHKMSLKGKIGMLRIDHQHGRFTSHEFGTDSSLPGWQRQRAVRRARTRGGVPVGGTDAGTTPLCEPETDGQGAGTALHPPHDRPEPGTGNPADHWLWQERTSEGGGIPAPAIRPSLYGSRRGVAGVRGQGARQPQRTGDAAHSGTRVRGIPPGSLPAAGRDFGSPSIPPAQHRPLPQTQHQLSADQAHCYPHRGTAQTATARDAGIPAHRHRASRRSRRPQGFVSHQRRRRSDAMAGGGGHCADLRTLAVAGVASDAGTVPLCDSRLSLRQRQRVHQLQRGRAAGETADRADEVACVSQRRQRTGGSEKRSCDSETHWLRTHRCATRRYDGPLSSRTPEPVCELSPSERGAENTDGRQRQANPDLRAMGDAVGIAARVATRCRVSAGRESRWLLWRRGRVDRPTPKPPSRCRRPSANCWPTSRRDGPPEKCCASGSPGKRTQSQNLPYKGKPTKAATLAGLPLVGNASSDSYRKGDSAPPRSGSFFNENMLGLGPPSTAGLAGSRCASRQESLAPGRRRP